MGGNDNHNHDTAEEQALQREVIPGEAVAHHGAGKNLQQHEGQGIEQGPQHRRAVFQDVNGHLIPLQGTFLGDQVDHGIVGILIGEEGVGHNAEDRRQNHIADADDDYRTEDAHDQVRKAVGQGLLLVFPGSLVAPELGVLINECFQALFQGYAPPFLSCNRRSSSGSSRRQSPESGR